MIVFYLLLMKAIPNQRLKLWVRQNTDLYRIMFHAVAQQYPDLRNAEIILPNGVMMPVPAQTQAIMDFYEQTDLEARYKARHGKQTATSPSPRYSELDQVRIDNLLEHLYQLPRPDKIETLDHIEMAFAELPAAWCIAYVLGPMARTFYTYLPQIGSEGAALAKVLGTDLKTPFPVRRPRSTMQEMYEFLQSAAQSSHTGLQDVSAVRKMAYQGLYLLNRMLADKILVAVQQVGRHRGRTERYQYSLTREVRDEIEKQLLQELRELVYTYKIWKALRM